MRRSMLRALGVLVGAACVLPATVAAAAAPPEPTATVTATAAATACTKTAAQVLTGLQGLRGQQQFTTVRHRGDFDAATPENSLGAFRRSYDRCRPGVETDLRHTADGKLVMFHDTHVGKMMEPTYDPERNTGPNAALTSLTLTQLQQKRLVTIDRRPSEWSIVTFEEFLADAVERGGPSLLFVEIKDNADILPAVRETLTYHQRHPQASIFDRVVFKIRLNAYPTFASWRQATAGIAGLPRTPLTQVMVSRVIADDVDRRTDLGTPSGQTPSYYATSTWAKANATTDGVLSVEVTMKDSAGFYETRHRKGSAHGASAPQPFRDVEYYAPLTVTEANARPGTMARLTALVRASDKPLGQFVPVPDWVMWRSGTVDWDQALPSVVGSATPITPREAYFQNDSRCCYALELRLADTGNDPEQNEQRTILPWMQDIGATVLTADDTDSIDAFFHSQNKLHDLGRPVGQTRVDPAPAAMNSLISPAVNQGTRRLSPTMMMVSVRSVRVTDIDDEDPGDLYGTVELRDTSTVGRSPLDVARSDSRSHYPSAPEVRIDAGGQALFRGGTLDVELWDRDRDASAHDLIAKRVIDLPAGTPDGVYTVTTRRGEIHHIPGTGSRETFGSATIVYTVQRYWTTIELRNVTIGRIDDENPGDLFGTIRTRHPDQPSGWSSYNFLLNRWEWISIRPGQSAPLHSYDAPGHDLASITFDLWDADGGSADDKIAQGTLTVDKHQDIDAGLIRRVNGQWGWVTATTSWNARTNRVPLQPLGFAPVVTGDGS
ncbi:glycerophosphodiester phosphodiesterase family protein [Cellulomonas sp. C5510]|uniref:glycerophosphodiester phosphodiesterase family protein n=1 Tax=Cellulomonas sp. C5510 TaxID=2871170 RepID=UPI001C981F4A|nr:glycerophosphodiester phosphodiesterase family protein [Cellulomonas sp. C5510]QZN86255.1 hypothetical protein K5O09_03400 [Cellulomonas sp. C5510]